MAFFSLAITAQITHRPSTLKLNSPLPIDSSDTHIDIIFNVEKDTTYTVYWKVIKDPNTWTAPWATYVCDKVLCYGENRDFNSAENEMGKGEHLFQFHFRPYAVAGCTVVELVLYGDSKFSEEIYRVKIDINGCVKDISHKPEQIKLNSPLPIDSSDTHVDIIFNVEKDTTYTVYWKVFKDPNTWMAPWATYVCDKVLCYGENRDYNSAENEMGKGEHLFQFHFRPYAKAGCTVVELVLYGDSRFSEEIYRVKIDINGCLSSTTQSIVLGSKVKVYPNPANEYFQLDNDDNVDKLRLFDISGREVKTFIHFKNAQHIIGDLKSGMYFLQLFDEKNRSIKTVKLNKVSS